MQQLQIAPLAPGETYVGAIGDQQGSVYHLILLAGDNDDASQAKQIEWARSGGGELPTTIEAAMLFERCPEEFQKDWYWTATDYPHAKGYAFIQSFDGGYQIDYRKVSHCRARRVRRLSI